MLTSLLLLLEVLLFAEVLRFFLELSDNFTANGEVNDSKLSQNYLRLVLFLSCDLRFFLEVRFLELVLLEQDPLLVLDLLILICLLVSIPELISIDDLRLNQDPRLILIPILAVSLRPITEWFTKFVLLFCDFRFCFLILAIILFREVLKLPFFLVLGSV